MSDPDCPANESSCGCGSQPAPGFFPCSTRLTRVSGQTRNRSVSAGRSGSMPNTSCGGSLKAMLTSVAVTGMHFPARISTGTPAHRHESTVSRTATKLSVVERGSTPSTSWYPSYCPRTASSGRSGRIARTSRDLASRQPARPVLSGGSAMTVAITCSMWFCTTSRMAPARS